MLNFHKDGKDNVKNQRESMKINTSIYMTIIRVIAVFDIVVIKSLKILKFEDYLQYILLIAKIYVIRVYFLQKLL